MNKTDKKFEELMTEAVAKFAEEFPDTLTDEEKEKAEKKKAERMIEK